MVVCLFQQSNIIVSGIVSRGARIVKFQRFYRLNSRIRSEIWLIFVYLDRLKHQQSTQSVKSDLKVD